MVPDNSIEGRWRGCSIGRPHPNGLSAQGARPSGRGWVRFAGPSRALARTGPPRRPNPRGRSACLRGPGWPAGRPERSRGWRETEGRPRSDGRLSAVVPPSARPLEISTVRGGAHRAARRPRPRAGQAQRGDSHARMTLGDSLDRNRGSACSIGGLLRGGRGGRGARPGRTRRSSPPAGIGAGGRSIPASGIGRTLRHPLVLSAGSGEIPQVPHGGLGRGIPPPVPGRAPVLVPARDRARARVGEEEAAALDAGWGPAGPAEPRARARPPRVGRGPPNPRRRTRAVLRGRPVPQKPRAEAVQSGSVVPRLPAGPPPASTQFLSAARVPSLEVRIQPPSGKASNPVTADTDKRPRGPFVPRHSLALNDERRAGSCEGLRRRQRSRLLARPNRGGAAARVGPLPQPSVRAYAGAIRSRRGRPRRSRRRSRG